MEPNKVYAVKKNDQWWAVIDCGETKTGGWATNMANRAYFSKNGKTYRWHERLLLFDTDKIEEWQEIKVADRMVCVLEENGYLFEGWEDSEQGMLETFHEFSKLIGHPLTVNEIKEKLNQAR